MEGYHRSLLGEFVSGRKSWHPDREAAPVNVDAFVGLGFFLPPEEGRCVRSVVAEKERWGAACYVKDCINKKELACRKFFSH